MHTIDIRPSFSAVLISICLFVAGCSVTGPQPRPGSSAPIAEESGRYQKPSLRARLRDYDAQAREASTPVQKAYYQLLGAETLMQLNKTGRVRERLEVLNMRALDPVYHYRVDLLNAQLALLEDKAPLALQKLPKNNIDYPLLLQANILRTRAIALAKLGYLQDSLSVRLELDQVLQQQLPEKQQALVSNHQLIWSILQTTPTDALQATQRQDPVINGWVELALNVRTAARAGLTRDLAVNNWLSRFPEHPAATTLAKTLRNQQEFLSEYPANIALLLPLRGRLAGPATAIRDGFLSGYFGHDSAGRPSIRIYDTGDNPEQIWLHYQTAVQEGATMIVGPLQKRAVSELVGAPGLSLPVLALNYAEEAESQSAKVIQFGLLPEDEARQAAELAIIKGQMRAVLFIPNNSFGERMQNAFSRRYVELGGQVLAAEKYSPQTDDHGASIQRALHIRQSKNRNSILRTVLKLRMKFEPRRREDVDAIFLAANPRHARNFRTQLKFYNSGDVSVYSTSHAYSGIVDAKKDRDLDGIVFTDMPWTLQGPLNSHFAAAASFWPGALNKYARLYALGLDAYRILPYLNQLKNNAYERFPGLTGSIAIDEYNKIHRELLWATFNKGRPEVLEFSSAEDHNLFDPEDDISYLETP